MMYSGGGRQLCWDLVVGSASGEERTRVLNGISRPWEEIFRIPLVISSEGWDEEKRLNPSSFANNGNNRPSVDEDSDDNEGEGGDDHQGQRARQSLAKGYVRCPI